MHKIIRFSIRFILVINLIACSSSVQPVSSDKATIDYRSQISNLLRDLPPPKKPIIVGVYKFRDQTGQYKSSDVLTQYSTAVSQGGTSMLIRALMEAGNGRWFTVLERENLTDLMSERKIISQTSDTNNLPPLLYAPVLLEGGIIAYETNLLTGGVGARYFGIGGSSEFRRDTVTTMLRAISVSNGEVLSNVDSRKTIFSMQMDSGLYRYVSYQRLLELEAGISSNEPPQMAVLESIEMCVYALIVEGLIKDYWRLADPDQKSRLISKYLNKTDAVNDGVASLAIGDEQKNNVINRNQEGQNNSSPSGVAMQKVDKVALKNVSEVLKKPEKKPVFIKDKLQAGLSIKAPVKSKAASLQKVGTLLRVASPVKVKAPVKSKAARLHRVGSLKFEQIVRLDPLWFLQF